MKSVVIVILSAAVVSVCKYFNLKPLSFYFESLMFIWNFKKTLQKFTNCWKCRA